MPSVVLKQFLVVFTPTMPGPYTADLHVPGSSSFGGNFRHVVEVFTPVPPSLVLPRSCSRVTHARNLIGWR